MYAAKRPFIRPAVFVFILASWLMAACATQVTSANWPGLSAEGDTVYVAYGKGVMAYDVTNQAQKWLFSPNPARLQFYAAPSVQDGRIVVGDFGAAGGFLSPGVVVSIYGLQNGEGAAPNELWANAEIATDRIMAPPLQVEDRVYVGTADNQLFALGAQSGELIWNFTASHSIWAKPAYKDGIIYLASLDKNVYALHAEDGSTVWQTSLEGAIAGAPVVNGDLLYVAAFDQKLHALSLQTGAEQWSAASEDWVWGTPVLADTAVYFADAQGHVYAVDAQTGTSLWSQQVDGVIQTGLTVADDMVYVVSVLGVDTDEVSSFITALDVTDGQTVWQQQVDTAVYTTPVIVDNNLVVAVISETDILLAFDKTTGSSLWRVAPPATE